MRLGKGYGIKKRISDFEKDIRLRNNSAKRKGTGAQKPHSTLSIVPSAYA